MTVTPRVVVSPARRGPRSLVRFTVGALVLAAMACSASRSADPSATVDAAPTSVRGDLDAAALDAEGGTDVAGVEGGSDVVGAEGGTEVVDTATASDSTPSPLDAAVDIAQTDAVDGAASADAASDVGPVTVCGVTLSDSSCLSWNGALQAALEKANSCNAGADCTVINNPTCSDGGWPLAIPKDPATTAVWLCLAEAFMATPCPKQTCDWWADWPAAQCDAGVCTWK